VQSYSSELTTDCFRLDFYKYKMYIINELNTRAVSLNQITMFYYFQIQICYNIIILFINDWFTIFRPAVYTGSIDCLVKTVRHEGFFALYKGFIPAYCRLVWFRNASNLRDILVYCRTNYRFGAPKRRNLTAMALFISKLHVIYCHPIYKKHQQQQQTAA